MQTYDTKSRGQQESKIFPQACFLECVMLVKFRILLIMPLPSWSSNQSGGHDWTTLRPTWPSSFAGTPDPTAAQDAGCKEARHSSSESPMLSQSNLTANISWNIKSQTNGSTYTGSTLGLHWVYTAYTLGLHSVYTGSTSGLHWLYTGSSLVLNLVYVLVHARIW